MDPKIEHSLPEDAARIPRHVAMIMDGNGRWARRQGLSRHQGHSEGAESVRVVTRECAKLGVEQLTLYAFSTENWRRPRTEVAFLMELLRRFLIKTRPELMENNIRLRTIGHTETLSARVRAKLDETMQISAANTGMVLRLAINYGGRQEILDAARKMAAQVQGGRLDPAALQADDVRLFLYDPQMTDPDLLIRTGGEVRLSNFLLWELSYTELYFTDVCWPEFRAAQLRRAFRAYAERERRYGGLAVKPRVRERASERPR